jgi:hypothetical protein
MGMEELELEVALVTVKELPKHCRLSLLHSCLF